MAGSEKRLRVSRMSEGNKITAEAGARLRTATGAGTDAHGEWASGRDASAGKWLRIRVTDMVTGRTKASVEIPVGLMDAGMKIGAQFAPAVQGVDMSSALDAVRAGASGNIIDVMDEANGERVEISVD